MKKTAALLNSPKGFTLIELVVVFVVISILATIGVASLVSYSRAQTLNQATSDLYATINSAKSLSSSQVKKLTKPNSGSEDALQCLDSQTLEGYGVNINLNRTEAKNYDYTLYIQCSGLSKTNSAWYMILPSGVSFDPSSATNIFFPVITGAVVTDKNCITLNGFLGSTKTISFNQGNITISQCQ